MSRFSKIALIALFALVPATFAQSGGVKGKVKSNKGAGIPNATVTARQSGKDIKTVRADAKGAFQLTGLSSGVYSLIFDADGFQTGLLQGVEVKGGVRDLGDRLILMPDQGNLVILNGSIFYKEGTSLGGAKVEIERVNADGTTKKLTTLYTNIQGEFTYKQPQGPSTKLRITAKFKGSEGVKEIDVDMAAIYRLAITLDISRAEK